MKQRHALQLLLIALALAGSACSASPAATESAGPAAGEAPRGERLLGQPPRGWRQVGATSVATLKRAVFLPEGEVEDAWTRRITFEAIMEDPLPDPIGFVDVLSLGRDRDCGTFDRHPTFSGEENGYPTSVNLLICHRDIKTERSEFTLMKTIRGNDAFYLITRSMRGPPVPKGAEPAMDETRIGGWAIYLKSITLCDDSRPGHPCPRPATD